MPDWFVKLASIVEPVISVGIYIVSAISLVALLIGAVFMVRKMWELYREK